MAISVKNWKELVFKDDFVKVLIKNRSQFKEFMAFAASQFSTENLFYFRRIYFLQQRVHQGTINDSELRKELNDIYEEFIIGKKEVNISTEALKNWKEILKFENAAQSEDNLLLQSLKSILENLKFTKQLFDKEKREKIDKEKSEKNPLNFMEGHNPLHYLEKRMEQMGYSDIGEMLEKTGGKIFTKNNRRDFEAIQLKDMTPDIRDYLQSDQLPASFILPPLSKKNVTKANEFLEKIENDFLKQPKFNEFLNSEFEIIKLRTGQDLNETEKNRIKEELLNAYRFEIITALFLMRNQALNKQFEGKVQKENLNQINFELGMLQDLSNERTRLKIAEKPFNSASLYKAMESTYKKDPKKQKYLQIMPTYKTMVFSKPAKLDAKTAFATLKPLSKPKQSENQKKDKENKENIEPNEFVPPTRPRR